MARKHDVRRGDGYIQQRVTKAGETRYSARWHDGVKWRAKTFATSDEAEDHLREIGRSKRRGAYTPESDATVSEIVDAYIERGAHRWSSNTVATYRLLAKQQIAPTLGKVRMVALTTPQVQRWIDKLTAMTLSASVIENARTVLSGACKEAMQMGMIRVNPVTGTRVPARKRTAKTIWTPDDVARVLDAVKGDVLYRAFYLVALTSAVRPGELRALKWSDIDLDNGIITVRRTMTRDAEYHHKIGDETKTHRTRSIAVPAETVDALRALQSDQRKRRIAAAEWTDHGLVFDRGDGNPLAQQTVSTHHRLVCDKAGVERCRLHDLRHAAATMLLANNVHPKIVSEMLGHSSTTITLDIYSHVSVDMQRAASEGLAETMLRKKRA